MKLYLLITNGVHSPRAPQTNHGLVVVSTTVRSVTVIGEVRARDVKVHFGRNQNSGDAHLHVRTLLGFDIAMERTWKCCGGL